MKIVFLGRYNPTESLTGPEKVAKRIFSEYTKTDKAVFIEYFFDGNKYSIGKKLFGKEIIADENGSQILRMGIFPLLKYLSHSTPDIIHVINYERFACSAFLYKFFSKAKIVYNVHGIVIHENTKYKNVSSSYFIKDRFCEKIFLKYSDNLIFLSEESVKIASAFFDIDRKKISILPNGVDEIFHLKGKDKIYPEGKKLKLLFVGSVSRKEKGYAFLNESLKELDIPFQLYVAGSSEFSDKESYINIPFTDTISFAGVVSGIDVFISASEYDPFSMAAAEAMAAGVVPVVTKETGMSRYIQDNLNGFVFNFGDTVELNKILRQINSDRPAIHHLSDKAKEIYELLNWQEICERYKELYKSILNP